MSNERGSAQIALIIFVVLTLALSGATYSLFMAKEKAAKIDLVQEAKIAKAAEIEKNLQGQIIDLNDKISQITKDFTDLEERYNDNVRALTETRGERNDAYAARDEVDTFHEDEKTKFRDELSELEKQLAEKRSAIETLEEEMATKEESLEERAAEIKATANEDIKKAQENVAEAKQEINQLKSRLAHLASDKEINFEMPEADGKIVFADSNNKFVIVNLTEADGAIPNMPFDVYEAGTQANAIKKGQIRIKQVKKDVTYAVIEKLENSLRPIIPGDFIGNPVFTRGIDTKKTFVLDGEFSTYNATEIGALIKDFGGIVEEEVSVKTDFLVVGLNPLMLRESKRLHIPLMKEEQLYRYIQKSSGK